MHTSVRSNTWLKAVRESIVHNVQVAGNKVVVLTNKAASELFDRWICSHDHARQTGLTRLLSTSMANNQMLMLWVRDTKECPAVLCTIHWGLRHMLQT